MNMNNKWIARTLTDRLETAISQFPSVMLSGARQVGKTALCRHVWPEANYVTLDLPAEAEAAQLNPESFLKRNEPPLIIDEVQYAPELLRYLKVHLDRNRKAGQYLITGSQDFVLMQGVTESLAGRCAILTLPTLSMEEVKARDLDAIDATAWRGGWPELQANPDLDRELWLGSYLTTYLERDVRNMLNIGSLRDFDRFLRAAAYRTGQTLSLSELARDVGIAVSTAKNWVSLLEASHQIFLIEPWHVNPGKRLIKSPKLYFQDVGFLLYLFGFRSWEDVVNNAAWGAIWENIVIAECRKALANSARRLPLYYWRTVNGEELDLLVEFGHRRIAAFEIKAAEQPGKDSLKGFKSFTRLYGENTLTEQNVVCRTATEYPLDQSGAQAVPLSTAVHWLQN